MNKSLRLILILAGILIVLATIGAIVVFFFFGKGGGPSNANVSGGQNANQVTTINVEPGNGNTDQTVEPVGVGPEDLEITALYFVERFGSYSNHTETAYQNIEELYIYMSDAMLTWAEKFVADERAKLTGQTGNPPYYGITTKALAPQLVSFDDAKGSAEFVISTQRRENTAESSEPRIFYQDIRVRFLKVDDLWKVDEARWLEETSS